MRQRALAWWLFGGSVTIGVGVLTWLSYSMLSLERREARAQAQLDHELRVGDVLWRMDSWLAPLLAHEQRRPAEEYRPFNPVAESYTNMLSKLAPGEVLVPSPLLTFRSDLFVLHFEIATDGTVNSPQVPRGNELDVAQSREPELPNQAQRRLLDRIDGRLDVARLSVQCSTLTIGAIDGTGVVDNFRSRAQSAMAAQRQSAWIAEPGGATPASPLTPMWFDDEQGALLLFVRSASAAGSSVLQGFVADWDALTAALLDAVRDADVARGARLERANREDPVPGSRLLTTIPAALVTAPPQSVAASWTPVCGLLLFAWIAFAALAVTVGLTLRQSIAFGERRSRFASAVAHELRTPLTTFRMYSELLATDMVTDPTKRREYLHTLQSESDRLARLVENVLGYARIEDGRFTAQRERIALRDLLDRHRAVLERRVAESARQLVLTLPERDATLVTDVEATGQILFNLVDNACKHGAGTIELEARLASDHITIAVRDHGRGIARSDHRRVFAAFDRGSLPPGEIAAVGVGLGLSLARGLARDLGGDLTLEDAGPGARFVLRLPSAALSAEGDRSGQP